MAKKKEVYKIKPLNENKKNIIAALIDEYDIETADDIQEALKDLLGGTIKSMMEAEIELRIEHHLNGCVEGVHVTVQNNTLTIHVFFTSYLVRVPS